MTTNPNKLIALNDTLQNLVSGLGTERDKATASKHIDVPMDDTESLAVYRNSWLGRKIVDIPANDSVRKWRKWQGTEDQIEKIEQEEKRLDIKRKVKRAMILARLQGGCALYISDGTKETQLPLNPASINIGGIKYVTVVRRRDLKVERIENDPLLPGFDRPAMYKMGKDSVLVHPSRLVVFQGAEIPDDERATLDQGWSDSVLKAVRQAITDADSTMANVASLIFEANVDVISLPDFMQRLEDPQYEGLVTKRLMLAATLKGINGTLVLDALEKYERKQANFSTLPDIIDRFLQAACGAADIPATRLLSMSPAGLNSTGEADLRNYYDRIQSHQELDIGPAMAILDECVIRSATGTRDTDIYYTWASLWQPTAVDQATIGKTKAETIKALRDSMLFPDDALSVAAANAMTENDVLPGLEAALAKSSSLSRAEEEANSNANTNGNVGDPENDTAPRRGSNVTPITAGRRRRITDATAPRPLYVRRDVVNTAEIRAWATGQGFADIDDGLHVTIAFSRTPVDWFKISPDWVGDESGNLVIQPGGPRMVDRLGGNATVLLISSSHLNWRHEEMKEAGASWDWPDYNPHITITFGEHGLDLDKIQPYKGAIVLGPEIFEPLDLDRSTGTK